VALLAAFCLLGVGLASSAARSATIAPTAGSHQASRVAAVKAALHADSQQATRSPATPVAGTHAGFPLGLSSADVAAAFVLLAAAMWFLLQRRGRRRHSSHVPYGYGPSRAPPLGA
jgi:hypothetical protein